MAFAHAPLPPPPPGSAVAGPEVTRGRESGSGGAGSGGSPVRAAGSAPSGLGALRAVPHPRHRHDPARGEQPHHRGDPHAEVRGRGRRVGPGAGPVNGAGAGRRRKPSGLARPEGGERGRERGAVGEAWAGGRAGGRAGWHRGLALGVRHGKARRGEGGRGIGWCRGQ